MKSIKSLNAELAKFVASTATMGDLLPKIIEQANRDSEVVSASLFKFKSGAGREDMIAFLHWLGSDTVQLTKNSCALKLDSLRIKTSLRQQLLSPGTTAMIHPLHGMFLTPFSYSGPR
jgi:hypothetical protein